MKDVMDFVGDKEQGVRSFPKYIGTKKSNILASMFFILAVIISFIPFLMQRYDLYFKNYTYLVLVFITDIMLIFVSSQLIFNKKPNLKQFRKLTLGAIFLGQVAFLIPIILIILNGG